MCHLSRDFRQKWRLLRDLSYKNVQLKQNHTHSLKKVNKMLLKHTILSTTNRELNMQLKAE